MSLTVQRFPVRVMVPDVWDNVLLSADIGTTVAELKRQALERSRAGPVDPRDYVVKFRGAEVTDEDTRLEALGVPSNAAFIVLSRRRRPVR